MRIDSRVVSAVASVLLWLAAPAFAAPPAPGPDAIAAARHAVQTYPDALVKTLGTLVSFNTVADKEIAFERNPAHLGFKQALKDEAARLGLDYADHGFVVVIGLLVAWSTRANAAHVCVWGRSPQEPRLAPALKRGARAD